jgi:hypothetical protein
MTIATHRAARPLATLSVAVAALVALTAPAGAAPPRSPGNAVLRPQAAAPPAATGFVLFPVSDAAQLLECLLGAGVSVSNVTLTAAPGAVARFSGGAGIIGFDSGFILSTGAADSVVGPNRYEDFSVANLFPGDKDLDTLVANTQGDPEFPVVTYDAAVLEFDFECGSAQPINIQYVFASEEYDEFVTTDFNDVFAVFLDGDRPEHNIARVAGACAGAPGQPIAINNVNCGFEAMEPTAPNCPCYINNGTGALDTEMDGMTRVFQATAAVSAGQHHMKIAIADTSDEIYDANVFVRCGSLACGTVPTRPSTWGQMKARYR